MTPPPFIPARERDAWATLRGFLYQLELSLEQWILLPAGHALELECGEDIDVIGETLSAEEPNTERMLQQVKYSENNVTLRSATVTEFLASAVEHRQTNPEVSLLFRYVTNAKIGIETSNPLKPRRSAIRRWQELCNDPSTADTSGDIAKILQILLSSPRPPKLGAATWDTYVTFRREWPPGDFFAFMKRVVWSTESGDVEQVQQRAVTALIRIGHATDDGDALLIHHHLFDFLFRVITQKGIKRLTPEQLEEQVRKGPSQGAILSRISAIVENHDSHDSRIGKIESEIQAHRPVIEYLIQGMGVPPTLSAISPTRAVFEPPVAPTFIVARTSIIGDLDLKLQTCRLLNMVGESGLGKTQTARELSCTREHTWVRTATLDAPSIVRMLGNASAHAASNHHSFIIIDGLRDICDAEDLADTIVRLSQTFKIVVTSVYSMPLKLRQELGDTHQEVRLPVFDFDSVRSLLEKCGAPQSLLKTDQVIHSIQKLTRGHPQLLLMAAEYLRTKLWSMDEDSLRDLDSGEYASDIRMHVQRSITTSVKDEAARDLLYRLDLVIDEVRTREIKAVSEVSPAIVRPGEKIALLLGPWVYYDSKTSILLSTLARGLSSLNLPNQLVLAVNRALADAILKERRVSEVEIIKAVRYLLASSDYEKAGAVYVTCAMNMPPEQIRSRGSMLPLLWGVGPLPEEVSVPVKILIRAAQIRSAYFLDVDTTPIISDLETLSVEGGRTRMDSHRMMAVVLAGIICGSFPREEATPVTQRLLRRAIQDLGEIKDPLFQSLSSGILSATCISGSAVKGFDSLLDWLKTMSRLDTGSSSPEATAFYFQSLEVVPEVVLTANRQDTIMRAAEIDRRVSTLLSDEPAPSALFSAGIYVLRIKLAREICDYSLLSLLFREALEAGGAGNDGGANFLIRSEYALQMWWRALEDQVVRSDIVRILARALESGVTMYPRRLLRAWTMQGILLSKHAPEQAEACFSQADEILSTSTVLHRQDVLVALAERAIFLSNAKGAISGFPAWDAVINVMFESMVDASVSDYEKVIVMALGSCTGYYSSLAQGRQSPIKTPLPGMFYLLKTEAAIYFEGKNIQIMAAQMWMYAEAAKDDKGAEKWARRAFVLSKSQPGSRALLAPTIIPFFLVDGAFAAAIDCALEMCLHVIARFPAGKFRPAEALAGELVTLPIFFRLATLQIELPSLCETSTMEVLNAYQLRADASGDLGWVIAGYLIDLAFVRRAGKAEYQQIRAAAVVSQDFTMAACAMLSASLDPSESYADAIAVQIRALHLMTENKVMTRLLAEKIVSPFLIAFWNERLRTARSQFAAPERVELEIAKALTARGVEALKALLSAVVSGLDVHLSANMLSWIDESKNA